MGGGACEAAAAACLLRRCSVPALQPATVAIADAAVAVTEKQSFDDTALRPVRQAVADALLAVPRVLAENAGARPLRSVALVA